MTSICIIAPVWGRPEMRDAFLDHMVSHQEHARKIGVELYVAIAGSEFPHSANAVAERGFAYVEVENLPLGNKFNEAIRLGLLSYDPDYICIMGSDTFVHPSIWARVKMEIDAGANYLGVYDAAMWDWRTDQCVYWPGYWLSNPQRAGEPIGPMRVIHKSLIPEGGVLYDPTISSSLDASASKKLPKCRTFESKPFMLVSCKEEISITPISKFPPAHLQAQDVNMYESLIEEFGNALHYKQTVNRKYQ